MPNWCLNDLTIVGSKEDLEKFYTENASTTERHGKTVPTVLSFNKAVPQPPEILATLDDPSKDAWYEWRCAHWGCKWDLGDITFENSDEQLRYVFSTAWSPPAAWLAAVAPKYPTLEFELVYSEEGNDVFGMVSAYGDQFEDLSYTEEEFREQHDPDYIAQVRFIKKLPYKKLILTYSDPESSFTDLQPSHYQYLDKHILARIKDKDLPLFVNREWHCKDAFEARLKGPNP